MKIKVTLGGYTKKYFSSKLSAINYARKVSTEKASDHANWTQKAEVITRFEVIAFENGKIQSRSKVSNTQDAVYY